MSRGVAIVGEEPGSALSELLRSAGVEWTDHVDPMNVHPPPPDRVPAFYLVSSDAASLGDGEVFAALRLAAPHVPRVLLSSPSIGAESLESAARHGMDDCLLLPLEAGAVAARLERLGTERDRPRLSARFTPKRVLLVGDGGRTREISDALQHCGHHVCEVAEDDAQRKARALGAIDLVVVVTHRPRSESTTVLYTVAGASRTANGALPPLMLLSRGGGAAEERMGEQRVAFADVNSPLGEICDRIGDLLDRSSRFLRVDGRMPFFCALEHREAGFDGRWESGFSCAISQGGIFVRTLAPLRAGAPIEVRIRVPTTGDLIDVTGFVAWSNPWAKRDVLAYPVGMAVQFLGVLSKEMAQLIEICRMLAAA